MQLIYFVADLVPWYHGNSVWIVLVDLCHNLAERFRENWKRMIVQLLLSGCLSGRQESCNTSKDVGCSIEDETVPRPPRRAFCSPVHPFVDHCPRVLLLLLLVHDAVGGEVGGEEADEGLPVVRQLPVGGGECHGGGVALARQTGAGGPVKPEEEEVCLQ